MSEENDDWFRGAFGIDVGAAARKLHDEASKAAVAVAGAVSAVAAGAVGAFPLGGSVGRGGKNAAGDVRAVQAALGIAADGDCGPVTIAAIEAYQRKLGHSKPDGRVDAGGATERALAAGGSASAAKGRSPSSGQATGKRTHKPLSPRLHYDG